MKRSAVGLLLFYKEKSEENENMKTYKITVAGTGYVGLSLSVLLAQHNQVTAVDIVPEKVEMINNRKSPIQDDYIEKYLAEKELNLTATLDAKSAYADADFVVIAAPTNVYAKLSVPDSKRKITTKIMPKTCVIGTDNLLQTCQKVTCPYRVRRRVEV